MDEKKEETKTKLHQVFVQANTVEGYRYLDLSGIVLNRIASRYGEYAIDPMGCLLKKPKDPKDPYAIRFSSDRIWLHYVLIESLTYVVDTAPEWIESISKDIEVTRFNRFGLRSEYFAPCANFIKASTNLARKLSGDVIHKMIQEVDDPLDEAFEYTVRIPTKQFIAGIRSAAIRVLREPTDPSEYPSDGLLFDVDIYRRSKPTVGFARPETKGFLKSAADQTYELLENIGYSLLEEG